MLAPIAAVVCVIVLGLLLYLGKLPAQRDKNLPPGPPTLPFIGNLHQIPGSGAHFKFTEWAQEFGEIFSLKLGPATAVVINSPRLVKELIDRKSSIYSNRPPSYISHDLITHGEHLLIMQYGAKWKLFRKLIHRQFNEGKCEQQYISLQNAEAVHMLKDFCLFPDQLMSHPKRYSNSIIMSILFGIRSSTHTSPHLVKLYNLMEDWSRVMETGAMPPVDIFPFLKYLPESVFSNWISRSRKVGKAMDTLYGSIVSKVMKRRLAIGTRGSFLDSILDEQETLNLSRDELNFLCGVLMEGGSDTSSSIILAFIHAMIKFPHVQEKAQKEIDSVIKDDRSPLWTDYDRLPYISMIVKETMRWRPVTPLAFPHAVREDDIVDGMHIPKGATVIINVWGLHHNPDKFHDPDVFEPERYAGCSALAAELAASPNYEGRDHYGYGSGRRICPGIHLADRNLFLAMAKLLWAFEFTTKSEINVDAKEGYSEGFLHCPKPFEASIKPRSQARYETILREFETAEKEVFSCYESA